MGLRKHPLDRPTEVIEPVSLPATDDTSHWLDALQHPEAEQRRRAARALAGKPTAVAALGAQLQREAEHSVREALFTSLAATPSAATANVLVPLLRSADALMRNRCIETLAQMPEAVSHHITRLLADTDPDVRILTLNLVGVLPSPQVNAWLLPVLQHEQHPNVVAAALEIIAETGRTEHRALLQAVKQRFAHDPFIGFAAEVALERIEAA